MVAHEPLEEKASVAPTPRLRHETIPSKDLPTFRIYQIYYLFRQRRFLDPALVPYQNLENEYPEWREFHIFRKEWLKGSMDHSGYTGFFSWKFREKARIRAQSVIDFARSNPGADAYFINPYPEKTLRFANVWLQGENAHPGLISLTEQILSLVGIPRSLTSTPHLSGTICYCNFWFANKKFWQAYMEFCLPIYNYIENYATEEERQTLWSSADKVSGAPMVPYIFERLFTEFILSRPDLKVCAFEYSERYLKRRYFRGFREFFHASDAIKRAFGQNQDADLALSIDAYGKAVHKLTKMRRWRTVRGFYEYLHELTRRPLPLIEP